MLLEAATARIETWPNVAKEDLTTPTFKEAKELAILLEQHRKEKAVEVSRGMNNQTDSMLCDGVDIVVVVFFSGVSSGFSFSFLDSRLPCPPCVRDRASTLC